MPTIPVKPPWIKDDVEASPEPVPEVPRVNGRFAPGVSGNPRGKPPGTRSKKNVVAAEFEKQGSELARVVIAKALEGDMQAASLALARLSGPLRASAQRVEFELDPDASISDQAKQVLVAVSRGELDLESARSIFDLLAGFVGLKDVETFLDELRRLRSAKSQQIPGGVLIQ